MSWSPGFLYTLTVSLKKVPVDLRHELLYDNYTILTYKIYILHCHFPLRRTGAYRHRKALTLPDDTLHGVRMKSSTQPKVSQLVQNCKYLPEILTSTTGTIFTRDPKAV